MDFVAGRRDLHYISEDFDKSKVKAVVLDLDGTVVDSIDQIVKCTRHAFALLKLPEPDITDIKSIIGKKLEEGLTFCCQRIKSIWALRLPPGTDRAL